MEATKYAEYRPAVEKSTHQPKEREIWVKNINSSLVYLDLICTCICICSCFFICGKEYTLQSQEMEKWVKRINTSPMMQCICIYMCICVFVFVSLFVEKSTQEQELREM